jgi:hypothetical protein
MRNLGLFLIFVLLCGLSGTAKAFQFSIQDPVTVDALEVFAGTPFTITFGACQLGESADGCFYGVNASGKVLTSLDAIFPITASIFTPGGPTCNLSNDPVSEFSEDPICGVDPKNPSDYEFLLTGSPGIPIRGFFTIEETGVTALDTFPTGTGTASAVPEPGSIALISTGTVILGVLLFRRKREVFASLA